MDRTNPKPSGQAAMLRWCAYCQGFQGEVAPLSVFTTTHGICPSCLAKGMTQLDSELDESHRLRAIQGMLYEAGKTGDTASAAVIVRFAKSSGLRSVDILLGLVTPLLYRIGNEWETGKITIAEQQQFSRFCERIYQIVKIEFASAPSSPSAHPALVFLFNVPGNHHSLGIRILSLWLQSKGIESREFHPPPSPEQLIDLVAEYRPRAILVSLSLATQATSLGLLAKSIDLLPSPQPKLLVGGYAVKHHLIAPVEGTVFIETMTGLDDLIRNLPEPTQFFPTVTAA